MQRQQHNIDRTNQIYIHLARHIFIHILKDLRNLSLSTSDLRRLVRIFFLSGECCLYCAFSAEILLTVTAVLPAGSSLYASPVIFLSIQPSSLAEQPRPVVNKILLFQEDIAPAHSLAFLAGGRISYHKEHNFGTSYLLPSDMSGYVRTMLSYPVMTCQCPALKQLIIFHPRWILTVGANVMPYWDGHIQNSGAFDEVVHCVHYAKSG